MVVDMDIQKKSGIPPQAKRVFKGVIFDVYQWEQEMYDGTTATFEKLKRPDTAVVIPVLPDQKILVASQEQPDKAPFMGFPGGRIDEGEEPLDGAKRELLEETGYASEDWVLFEAQEPVGKIDWTIYTFIARNTQKIAEQNLDGGEKIELRILSFEELIELATQGNFYDLGFRMKALEALAHPEKMVEFKKQLFG